MYLEVTDPARFFEEHLRAFVPSGAFDAHAHLYPAGDVSGILAACFDGDSDSAAYTRELTSWMGDRAPKAGLFFGMPEPDVDRGAANRMVAREAGLLVGSRYLELISPADDPDAVAASVRQPLCAGFKVYHVYASRPNTFDATIGEYLPRWAWELAHKHRLAIMLHMVRDRALADPANQQYLREHCQGFPGANVILAHAARGFCGRHTAEGIGALRGLDNVYFDTSAICEPTPFEEIIRAFGVHRLLFGTDFPVSELTGKCVSIADGFFWMYAHNVDWQTGSFAKPTHIGIESLLALQQAARTLHLRDDDLEAIFCRNAPRLLGIEPKADGALTQATYRRAKELIPGGTQLLSKRPEQYAPERWPAYFREARECEVIDLDGRRFIDMTTSGIGSCLLGYADPDVTAAVVRRVALGSMCTLNPAEEVELAELLLELHPWAEQARFCRTGGEAMAVAVRIARAATGRDKIAFCGYHGWSDWYLATNLAPGAQGASASDRLQGHLLPGLEPAGVPEGLAGTMFPFSYNRLDELAQIVKEHGPTLAAVVMEPTRSVDPNPGFLEGVRDQCNRCDAALVLDEITAGWRLHPGGAHLRYGLTPDMAVFAKALGNGHPMAAVIGRKRLMDAAQHSFISSTYWTEGVGPTAALATVRKLLQNDVPAHVARVGDQFRDGWLALGIRHGVPSRASGHPALLSLTIDHPDALALMTLWTVRMLEQGWLCGGGFYPSLAHSLLLVNRCLAAGGAVFAELADSIQQGDVRQRLNGHVRQSGFMRLT